MPCDCRVTLCNLDVTWMVKEREKHIHYCKLHAAAPALREALWKLIAAPPEKAEWSLADEEARTLLTRLAEPG